MGRTDDETTKPYKLLTRGTQVSHYKIVHRIGIGGMGEVYLADDVELNRQVALKFLAYELSNNELYKSRFLIESLAVARINHPNIITIYEMDEYENRPFFVSEYISGESLRSYFNKIELTILEVIAIAIQICDGLVEAHNNGICHGDIKPTNLMFSNLGHIKILDFGVALIGSETTPFEPDTIHGTAMYMSPEQLQGKGLDFRSDLFSLGIVLYETLTRKNPFNRPSEREIFTALLESDPLPMERLRSGIPENLQRIISKLLIKNRNKRYQTAQNLRDDLIGLFQSIQTKDMSRPRRSMSHQPSIAVLPFKDLSLNQNQKYFCDGIAEEIRRELSKTRNLQVAARIPNGKLEKEKDSISNLGRKLGVGSVLSGSVQKTQDQIRVSIELVDTVSGFILWSNKYEKKVEDIFLIQDEISSNIVQVLQVVLVNEQDGEVSDKFTDNISAYDFYLRGKQYFYLRRKRSLEYAIQMFQRAIEIDDEFANAYAYLSFTCSFLIHFYGVNNEEIITLAREASCKALKIAPSLSESHTAYGFVLWLDNDVVESEKEYETAIKLNPKQFYAYYLYGRSCFQRGLIPKAAQLFEHSCKIRDDHEARYFTAQAYTALNRDAEAKTAYSKAIKAIERHIELNPDDARAVTFGAVAWCRLGEVEKGKQWSERAIKIDPYDAGIRYNVACLYALEGFTDEAITHLEKAVEAGFAHKDWVDNDPDLDSLRDNPRFKALKWHQ